MKNLTCKLKHICKVMQICIKNTQFIDYRKMLNKKQEQKRMSKDMSTITRSIINLVVYHHSSKSC